jgi:hypothetical protein
MNSHVAAALAAEQTCDIREAAAAGSPRRLGRGSQRGRAAPRARAPFARLLASRKHRAARGNRD